MSACCQSASKKRWGSSSGRRRRGLADSAAFPDATVWSSYGGGYGYVPLVLPVLGLLWLRRTRARWEDAGGAG